MAKKSKMKMKKPSVVYFLILLLFNLAFAWKLRYVNRDFMVLYGRIGVGGDLPRFTIFIVKNCGYAWSLAITSFVLMTTSILTAVKNQVFYHLLFILLIVNIAVICTLLYGYSLPFKH